MVQGAERRVSDVLVLISKHFGQRRARAAGSSPHAVQSGRRRLPNRRAVVLEQGRKLGNGRLASGTYSLQCGRGRTPDLLVLVLEQLDKGQGGGLGIGPHVVQWRKRTETHVVVFVVEQFDQARDRGLHFKGHFPHRSGCRCANGWILCPA